MNTMNTQPSELSAQQLLEHGDQKFSNREYSEAKLIYEQAVAVAQANNDNEATIQALSQVARCYLIQGKKEDGRIWLQQAEEIADVSQPAGWSRFLGVRGRFEWKDDKLETATDTFIQMYDYCMQYELHDRAVDAAHMVAITAKADQQIEWAYKGIAAAEAGDLDKWLGPLWNNLGWTYDELGRYKESLEALIKARFYHWKVSISEQAKLVADWSVGHAYRTNGDNDTALAWIQPVLAWAQRRHTLNPTEDTAEWVGQAYKELAEIALTQSNPDEALINFRLAKQYLLESKMPEWGLKDFRKLEQQVAELEDKIKG